VVFSIEIRMSGHGAEEELRSLYAWLQDEPDVRHTAEMTLTAGAGIPGEGEMGTAIDVIQLVIGDGFQALNLALAYATWRGTRAKHPSVTIEHAGIKVMLDDADGDMVKKIVDLLS
jgi:membrane-associated two-gene conflict system component 1 (EACC1)